MFVNFWSMSYNFASDMLESQSKALQTRF